MLCQETSTAKQVGMGLFPSLRRDTQPPATRRPFGSQIIQCITLLRGGHTQDAPESAIESLWFYLNQSCAFQPTSHADDYRTRVTSELALYHRVYIGRCTPISTSLRRPHLEQQRWRYAVFVNTPHWRLWLVPHGMHGNSVMPPEATGNTRPNLTRPRLGRNVVRCGRDPDPRFTEVPHAAPDESCCYSLLTESLCAFLSQVSVERLDSQRWSPISDVGLFELAEVLSPCAWIVSEYFGVQE